MAHRKSPKQIIKRLLVPFVGPVIRVLHVRVFGRQVFANKYARRIPVFSQLLNMVESRLRLARTAEARKQDYQKWFKRHYPRKKELIGQHKEQQAFKSRPLISLLMPTYNTDNKHLQECLDSVINQSYDNWELCIADDTSIDASVRTIIKEYAQKDQRIKYVFRQENGHICKASNSALELAGGEYVALLDHDDMLWPNALYEVVKLVNEHPDAKFIYSDEDKLDETGKKHVDPFFKPDWSYDFLRSVNYITHFAVLDRKLVKKLGGFRPGYEGAQDWDLFLRASRELDYVYHVPTILYSWRKSENSTAQRPSSKDYAYVNQKKALEEDIRSRGLKANLSWQIPFSMWRVDYQFNDEPLVSIVIPTKDQYDFIRRCLDSIRDKTIYKNFELVIVDTGSTDNRVWALYDTYKSLGKSTRVVKWDKKPFNFAAACDFGADHARGEYLLFLNNDTEVISSSWLQDMVGYARQEDVGAVGCKLFYPDGKLQHAGIILGVGGQNGTPGIAGHFFPAFIDNPPQDPAQLTYVGGTRNFTAVTAACVMVSKAKFEKVGGFDPTFQIAFNDVDFCLKLLDAGFRNIYLPHVTLYHHESISVGQPGSKQRNLTVFAKEINLMLKKWKPLIENDPFYHPEFRKDVASARLKI
jgi:GT2 family glycosyltransferase